MKKSKENYPLPNHETPEKKPEIKTAEISMPSTIEELDHILQASEKMAITAAESEKEIDEMIKQRAESLKRLQGIDLIKESRLKRIENYNPLQNLQASDYERLVQEKIIDLSYADRLKKLDNVIAKLETIDYPSADVKSELEKLYLVRNAFREKIENQITERQEILAAKREKIKNKILEHYSNRIKKLEEIIASIEADPRLTERLKIIREKEQQEAQARIEKEWEKIFQECGRYIQSLEARHQNVFKRLIELTENEKIVDELLQALDEEDIQKKKDEFYKTRKILIDAIIYGEGAKQIKEPKEIVPWKISPTSIPYREAIKFLLDPEIEKILQTASSAGKEQAIKLLERRNKIVKENEMIRFLVGREWFIDPKTNEKKMGKFWMAFQIRKERDIVETQRTETEKEKMN